MTNIFSSKSERNIKRALKLGYFDVPVINLSAEVGEDLWLLPNQEIANEYGGVVLCLVTRISQKKLVSAAQVKNANWPDHDKDRDHVRVHFDPEYTESFSYNNVPKIVLSHKEGQKGINRY